jgi:hypothetical protein
MLQRLPKTKNRPVNVGHARTLSDMRLVNAYFEDSTSRAIYERVILERMQEDGYTNYARWVQSLQPKREQDDPLREFIRTPEGVTLAAELRDYSARFPFEASDYLDDADRCREFCSEEGNIYDLTEDELTRRRLNMLKVIRYAARRWLRKQREQG